MEGALALPTLEARVAALKDPAIRAELVAEGHEKGMWYDPNFIHPLGTGASPDYHEEGGDSLAAMAAKQGRHPVEIVIDRLIESDGHELFNTWFFNRNVAGLKQLLTFDHVYPGLADTGAHAGQICDADMGTHYLAYWARDELTGFADACADHEPAGAGARPARRSTVAVGHHADLNVFDVDALASEHPTYANDFPNGAGRLKIGARGYAATLVNGQVITEQGVNTGARPGGDPRVLAGLTPEVDPHAAGVWQRGRMRVASSLEQAVRRDEPRRPIPPVGTTCCIWRNGSGPRPRRSRAARVPCALVNDVVDAETSTCSPRWACVTRRCDVPASNNVDVAAAAGLGIDVVRAGVLAERRGRAHDRPRPRAQPTAASLYARYVTATSRSTGWWGSTSPARPSG
ncbi:MAG: hypothetical protein R2713_01845 [Ilumatobacteraceae bacterium]